ncbi:hypothetical protein MED134_07019 [Dokdonia sp. MED134]|uniref:hypothetical protein n=1 Tax=Dokdonia sp. MED134 TaxID=313590 RepID=UPI000068ABD0|nr:hypothetical protein [Dokdonia sp. MED134]EAQ40487.1 hypothetical protein MED134_07019 [Dokdonia sp. MED134]
MISVLWIDDQWKDQQDFIGYAEQRDINIDAVDNSIDGIAMLKANSSKYHAVILDAKVKLKEDSLDTNLEGLKKSRDYLIELNVNSYLPFYIFTGQPDYVDSELFEQSFGEYFIKGDGNEKLLESIIKDAGKQKEMQARTLYNEAFKIFDFGIIDSQYKHLLVDIISCLMERDYRKKNIPVIRDLFEAILKSLNKPYQIIPDALIKNDGAPNLAHCVRFLEGLNTTALDGTEHSYDKEIPRAIKGSLRKLKESTSEYSHLNENDILKYEFLSNAHTMLELLVFLPKFIKKEYLD